MHFCEWLLSEIKWVYWSFPSLFQRRSLFLLVHFSLVYCCEHKFFKEDEKVLVESFAAPLISVMHFRDELTRPLLSVNFVWCKFLSLMSSRCSNGLCWVNSLINYALYLILRCMWAAEVTPHDCFRLAGQGSRDTDDLFKYSWGSIWNENSETYSIIPSGSRGKKTFFCINNL